jgi:predicted 3-demethylubiquinone-9 3-methyltransferase (glyoxalase superfamily)
LKDRYGLSWQVVPSVLPKLLASGDANAAQRTMKALLQMKKPDIAALERAHAGP